MKYILACTLSFLCISFCLADDASTTMRTETTGATEQYTTTEISGLAAQIPPEDQPAYVILLERGTLLAVLALHFIVGAAYIYKMSNRVNDEEPLLEEVVAEVPPETQINEAN